ncbi:MAG: hypothetical protein KJ697_05230 [Nanoarchaeota archaeon]|nr:hypothetical protein [Nanoarchaeota archaeon]MBU4124400.1 hypothetical protein [Nanoarchaeota archaeon]
MENDKIGKYWVKFRHLRHDYSDVQPDQDIRTMSREEAQKYKYRGNWFQRSQSYLELMKYDMGKIKWFKFADKKLVKNIDNFLDSQTSSTIGGKITPEEVARANDILDETILYLESVMK